MDNMTLVLARIDAIRAMVPPPRAPDATGFADHLDRATAPPIAEDHRSGTVQVTLGEFVGGARAAHPGVAAAAATLLPTGFVRPVAAPVNSGFGMRHHPILGVERKHNGVDISAPTGTPIRALASGVVSFAGDRGGYGKAVFVDHPHGLQSRYAHQSRIAVEPGQRVAAGEVIGFVGSTGLSTGPHLHLEVRRDGDPVDPSPYLAAP